MNNTHLAGYRLTAAVWFLTVLLGRAWFADRYDDLENLQTLVVMGGLLLGALIPATLYGSIARLLPGLVYIGGIGLTVAVLYLNTPDGIMAILSAAALLLILLMLTRAALFGVRVDTPAAESADPAT